MKKSKIEKTRVFVGEKEFFSESKFMTEEKVCDRCGNDLMGGNMCIHLPFKKLYIRFCTICYEGLMLEHYKQIRNLLEVRSNGK